MLTGFGVALIAGAPIFAQGQQASPQALPPPTPQADFPRPAKSQSQELLGAWNDIHRKLIAMAEDFPEEKYGFRVQKDERTFADNILHVAGVDFHFIDSMTGKKDGPEGGDNPPRSIYKTKEDVVKWIKADAAAGAALIEKQGDKGINKETKSVYENAMGRISSMWWEYIEHAGEHYGQLVVYYRANNMVPPESRPQPK
jgi:uncharacterized damage-inducible protein DinB